MKRHLRNMLSTLSVDERNELQLALGIAQAARRLQVDYNLSDMEMSIGLDIDPDKLPGYLSGAVSYKLEDISRLQQFIDQCRVSMPDVCCSRNAFAGASIFQALQATGSYYPVSLN